MERRRRPPRRRVRPGRALAACAVGVVVFALGVALGQAIEGNDAGGPSVTYRGTIHVSPVPETVTVTVTGP